MNIKELNVEELEARMLQIRSEIDNEDADLDALETEARSIKAELDARRAEEAQRNEAREAVAQGAGTVTETTPKTEENTMTNEEIRASKEYMDAFARYLVSEDDRECRALLTENVTGGVVPVPTSVDTIIHTAWENDEILSRVNKTFIRGNLKVAFERSATGAAVHTEGSNAPTEETLVLGIVTMIPANIKKWIRISDEVVAMGGQALVDYVYDELTHQIIMKLRELVIGDIAALPATATATSPAAAKITSAPSLTAITEGYANLSDEATDNVVIMNRLTYAAFVAAQAAGNFAFDPFMGLPVLFTSALPAYSAASAGAVYAIVGDLKAAHVNYPEGDDVVIKWDDTTEAEKDLVKVVGRQYAAHGVDASGRFALIAKAST